MPSMWTKLWRSYRERRKRKREQSSEKSERSAQNSGTDTRKNKSILTFPKSLGSSKGKRSRKSLKHQHSVTFLQQGADSIPTTRQSACNELSSAPSTSSVGIQFSPNPEDSKGIDANDNSIHSNVDARRSPPRLMRIDSNTETQPEPDPGANATDTNDVLRTPTQLSPSVSSIRKGISTVLSLIEISPKCSSSKEGRDLLSARSLSGSTSSLLFGRHRRQIHPSFGKHHSSLESTISLHACLSMPSIQARPNQGHRFTLNDLPTELIEHICRYVPRDASYVALRCTSTRLNRLLNTSTITKTTCLRICDDLKPKLILSVLAVSPNLKVLNVAGCLAVTDEFLVYVAKNCRTITDLDIAGCVMVTDSGLEKVAHYLRHIESLCVANLRQVTCEGLIRLMMQHTNTIKALDISCCYGLEESAFRLSYLGEFCPNLESLTFRWSTEHSTWIAMWETRVSQLCELCPKLTQLDLSCSPSRDIKSILCTLANSCANMRYLRLSRCCVRDDSLLKLSSLGHLELLDLSHSPELSGVSLVFTVRQLPLLRHLDLSGCTKLSDESMVPLLSALPQIRELFLSDCHEIGDSGLSRAPALCPKLGYLDASGTMLTSRGVQSILSLGGSHFVLIMENCPLLGMSYEQVWQRIPLVALPVLGLRSPWSISNTDMSK